MLDIRTGTDRGIRIRFGWRFRVDAGPEKRLSVEFVTRSKDSAQRAFKGSFKSPGGF
jgi:hypothetical protein